jgi:hypothetical protein
VDRGGSIERQLQRDRAGVGVGNDVRPRDTEVGEHGPGVRCLPRDSDLAMRPRAAGEAASVVADDAIPLGQRRYVQQGSKGLGQDAAVDQQDRLSRSALLELQLRVVDENPR